MSGSRYWNKGVMLLSSSSYHRTSTYFWSVWNLGHLDVIFVIGVGVVRLGFRCSADRDGPEKASLCSEAPDEDALVTNQGWIVLSIIPRKSQRLASKSNESNELGQANCYDIVRLYGPCSN
jgi:hypothetical protein